MNHARDSFIDAYGLELRDNSVASQAAEANEPEEQTAPSYRFDAASRSRGLRGPHFDTRRVAAATSAATEDTRPQSASPVWDSGSIVVDMNFGGPASPETIESHHTEAPQHTEAERFESQEEPRVDSEDHFAKPLDEVVAEPELTREETSPAQVEERLPEPPSEAPKEEVNHPSPSEQKQLAPAWEVDCFCWPEEIEELFSEQADYFDFAGKKLMNASREGLKVLAVTSVRSGEGATTTAMCLARAAATAGAKVVLFDGNLRNPELGDRLGVDFSCGWQVAATGDAPLPEAAIAALEENITLLASAKENTRSIRSLGDPCVAELIRQTLDGSDLVIIDAGQEELGDNASVIDGAIVVRDVRSTSEQRTLDLAMTLKEDGVKAVGVAENFGSDQTPQTAAAA